MRPDVTSVDVDRRAERDHGRVGVGLDDRRVAQALGQARDLGLQVRLVLLGGVVLRVLGEVAELAGDEDPLRDRAPPLPSSSSSSPLSCCQSLAGDRFGHAPNL